MSYASAIEWTDTTWNPVRGCTKVSPGCRNCYAEVFAERWRGVPGHPYEFGFDLRLVPEKLVEPLTWSRPRKIFVNSMSDLFQEGVPDDFIVRAFEVMQAADWHAYQVLTKRTERMKNLVRSLLPALHDSRHIWLGVSVEDKKHGIPRIKHLQETPAAVRFLSIEPLLEDLGKLDLKGIHWVIVGGESGHGARPLNVNWVNSILRQCRTMEVPFFFKQWGGVQKKKAGRMLNGRLYDEYPTMEFRRVPHRAERIQRLKLAQQQQDTSPFIAIEKLRRTRAELAAKNRQFNFRCLFIEREREPFRRLQTEIAAVRDAEIKTLQGEFENLVPQAAAFASEGKNPFGFYFIDPTGWTGYPMSKLRPLFSNRYSELLINFMTRSQSHDEVHTRGASLPVVRVREKKIPLCPNLVCNVRF